MSEPYGYTIFCDDIREEVGNKVSYMGRYLSELIGTDALPGQPPPGIPKFCAAIQLIIPRSFVFSEYRVVIFEEVGSEKKILGELTAIRPADPPDAAGDLILIGANFVMAPFILKHDSWVRARAYLDAYEIKAGSLRIKLRPPLDG